MSASHGILKCKFIILVLCVSNVSSCVATSNDKTQTPTAQATRGKNMQGVIQIQLDTQYNATLKNISSIKQMILHSREIQPSKLRMIDPKGNEVQAFDRRSIQKFDNTVYVHSFTELAPENTIQLFKLIEKNDGNRQKLIWGPYEYSLTTSGEYQITVLWTSNIDTYINDTRKTEVIPDVPQGTVSSNEMIYTK